MRPGPGLVVMALAFLSGARRGGTTSTTASTTASTSTSTTISTSSSSSSSTATSTASSSSSSSSKSKQQQQQSSSSSSSSRTSSWAPFELDYFADQPRYEDAAALSSALLRAPSDSVLARINPWLSACDLAQPATAPDLQGECSAGALPVPTVSEGPGPPSCPESCAVVRLRRQQSESNAERRSNNNNLMSNTRMSGAGAGGEAMVALAEDWHRLAGDEQQRRKQQQQQPQSEHQQQQQHQQPPQQQCLDYFGDSEANSPAHLCASVATNTATSATRSTTSSTTAAAADIGSRLRWLRLRHCCERTALSALHNEALAMVRRGGADCVRTLNDLLEADALAERVTCELNDILMRYDCRQLYSIKHGCLDCKEAYRRWVCSTLIPYFAEPDDIRAQPATGRQRSTRTIATTMLTAAEAAAKAEAAAAAAAAATSAQMGDTGGGDGDGGHGDGGGQQSALLASHVHKRHTYSGYPLPRPNTEAGETDSTSRSSWRSGGDQAAITNPPAIAAANTLRMIPTPTLASSSSAAAVATSSVSSSESSVSLVAYRMLLEWSASLRPKSPTTVLPPHQPHQPHGSTEPTTTTTTPPPPPNAASTAASAMQRWLGGGSGGVGHSGASTTSHRTKRYDRHRGGAVEDGWSAVGGLNRSFTRHGRKQQQQQQQQQLQLQQHQVKQPQQQQQQQQESAPPPSSFPISRRRPSGGLSFAEDPVVARLLRRSRRKSETVRRKIRPCLSVCQTVEENCPYMLPNDRAPAMPTQYAGEPTFLCLDPNIPETGDQLAKSNHGPDSCCYRYCSASVLDGICAVCHPPQSLSPEADEDATATATTSAAADRLHNAAHDETADSLDWWWSMAPSDLQAHADSCPAAPPAPTGPRCMSPQLVTAIAEAEAAANAEDEASSSSSSSSSSSATASSGLLQRRLRWSPRRSRSANDQIGRLGTLLPVAAAAMAAIAWLLIAERLLLTASRWMAVVRWDGRGRAAAAGLADGIGGVAVGVAVGAVGQPVLGAADGGWPRCVAALALTALYGHISS